MSEIYLMTCKDDRKRIDKSPVNIRSDKQSIPMVIKEPTSITNPVVTISEAKIGKNWPSVNYAYIPLFQRYYFVDKITCLSSGLLELTMTIDVLYTYCEELVNTSFEVARSEALNSSYYIDTEKALMNRKEVVYEDGIIGYIPQDASGNKYVITVAGGV